MAFAPIAMIAMAAVTAVGGLMEAAHLQDRAQAARARAAAAADRQRRDTERQLSALRARFGGAGVQLAGSPVNVLGDRAAEGELDALDTLYAGELDAWRLRRQASQKRFEAGTSLLTRALGAGQSLGGGGAASAASSAGSSIAVAPTGTPDIAL